MDHLGQYNTLLRSGLLAATLVGTTPGWAAQPEPTKPECNNNNTISSGNWVLTANVGPCDSFNTVGPALIVEGPARLDMNGYMVLCEDVTGMVGVPTGIQVTGQNAEITDGTVKGCSTGISVKGGGHHKLAGLTVVSSQGNGIEIGSDDNRLKRVSVLDSGGEGIRIEGAGNRVVDSLAAGNHDHGIRVKKANNNRILDTRALNNRGDVEDNKNPIAGEGIRLEGDHNVAKRCIAIGNGDEGVRVKGGEGNVISHCLVQANGTTTGEPGIEVGDDGPTHTIVEHNRAIANAADGIAIEGGQYTLVRHNRALANGSVLPSASDTGPAPFGAGIRVRQATDEVEDGNPVPVLAPVNNRLTHNTARGNRGDFDLVDENVDEVGNLDCDSDTWRHNRFDSADPDDCIQ